MLSGYPQYPGPVSINEVEQAFLSEEKMYLSTKLSDIFYMEIYHSEQADAENDECVLILMVGTEESAENNECIFLNSETYPLEQIIEHFKIDRDKAMWSVSKDEHFDRMQS